jgi:hypothetical protein
MMWHVSYAEVAVDDVAIVELAVWMNHVETRGIFLSNGLVPRGPGMGCHVAPHFLVMVVGLKIYGVRGDRTPDLPQGSMLWQCVGYH